jgi:hypothetical protein
MSDDLKSLLEDLKIVSKKHPAFELADRICPLYAVFIAQGMERKDAYSAALKEYFHLLERAIPGVAPQAPEQDI